MGYAIDEFMITRYELETIDAACVDILERARARVRAYRTWEDYVRYLSTPAPLAVDEEDDPRWDWCDEELTNPTLKEKK